MNKIEEAYIKYKQKVEKNLKNDASSTDRQKFVLIFNESQNKFIEFHLQDKSSDDIRYIENFLVPFEKIEDSKKNFDRQDFKFPKGYLDLSALRAFISKDSCKEKEVEELFEVKMENLPIILNDENNEPSFKWRAAPYTLNSNTISVYNNNEFDVNYIMLSYYRYPNQIKLIDPNDPESKFDESIEIEWDAKSLDRIISIAAGEFDLNENNPRFQLQQLRTQKVKI